MERIKGMARSEISTRILFFSLIFLISACLFLPDVSKAQTANPRNTECGPGLARDPVAELMRFFGINAPINCIPADTNSPVAGAIVQSISDDGVVHNFDKGPGTATTCESSLFAMWSPWTCLMRSISVYFSSSTIAITAWFLTLSGSLLNYVVETTVISFSSSIYAAVNNTESPVSLNVVWAVFRDLANIAILGAFTFIAISIILGKVTFNNKRLVANVLVAALLINFSLVFSRVIVQTAGITSCQFYKVIVDQDTCENKSGSSFDTVVSTLSVNNTVTTISTPSPIVTKDGLAGSFLRIVGIGGFKETSNSLTKLANDKDGGVSVVLLHGVFTSLFLLVAVIVFLVMAIILTLRAGALLFLMCISPFAFAAYAIPQWSSKFGQWWEALIRQAFFAPFLLILLWMTSAFGKALTNGKGVIGQALAEPAKATSVQSIFLYLFVMGMLVMSVYLALRFARSLSGMQIGTMIGTLPVVAGSLGAGALLRNRLGGAAYGRAHELERKIELTKRDMSINPKDYAATMKSLNTQRGKALTTAGKDFNLMNTKPMQGLAGLAGLKGVWGGATKGGGYTGRVEAKAKEKTDDYKSMVSSDKDKQEVIKKAQGSHLEDKARAEEQLAATKEGNKLMRDKIISERDSHKQVERQQKDVEREATAKKAEIQSSEPDTPERARKLTEQDEKISGARQRIIEAQAAHKAKAEELVNHNRDSNNAERAIHTELKEINTRLRDTKLEALGKLLEINKSVISTAEKKLGTDVGTKVAKDSGAKDLVKGLKDEIEALQKENLRAQRIASDAQARASSQTPPPTR